MTWTNPMRIDLREVRDIAIMLALAGFAFLALFEFADSAERSFAGVASFYGNESGSKTASGQRFNENAMTCAHRSLPFGTKLRVTYRGRSVVVTVNDRGPFIDGRVLDLSAGAARAIGLTDAGIGHVTAEVI
jgi:rare lipoprotein A